MRSVLFLRIAAILTFIHSLLHTIGGVFGKPEAGLAAATVAVMQTNHFPIMGISRSYFDFYRGMGLAVSVFLLVESIVFWQLARLAKSDAQKIRPILAVFLFGYLALAVNSYLYLFTPPVVTELAIALCLALAMFSQPNFER